MHLRRLSNGTELITMLTDHCRDPEMQSKYLTAVGGMQRHAVQLKQGVQRTRQKLVQLHGCSRTEVHACARPQACAVVHDQRISELLSA